MNNVAAYIESLPNKPAAQTIKGDADRGKELYITCSKCHGKQAEGRWALNAPRIAGMSDWYLLTQLKNFKDGKRGAHPDDITGRQMESMVLSLNDEKMQDVIAYINSL
ncbi:MAG: c-type cytochrome [Gammaproteobacteria bacterium]|nr:c-type cytochrome [Gammaproteobacteria bacterium]